MTKKVVLKKCKTCGKSAKENGHLCTPVSKKDHTCDWCGSLIMNARHMCDSKLKKVSFICNSCGRLAVSADHLCKPKRIK